MKEKQEAVKELKPYCDAAKQAAKEKKITKLHGGGSLFTFVHPNDNNCNVVMEYEHESHTVVMTQDYGNGQPTTDDISLDGFKKYIDLKTA